MSLRGYFLNDFPKPAYRADMRAFVVSREALYSREAMRIAPAQLLWPPALPAGSVGVKSTGCLSVGR